MHSGFTVSKSQNRHQLPKQLSSVGNVLICRAMGLTFFIGGIIAFVQMVSRQGFEFSVQAILMSLVVFAVLALVGLGIAWSNSSVVLFLGDRLQVKSPFNQIEIPLHQIIEVGSNAQFGNPNRVYGFVIFRDKHSIQRKITFAVSIRLLLENSAWLDELHLRAITTHQEFYGQNS